MDIIDQMNAALESGQMIFGASSVSKLLACALKLRAQMVEAIADEKRDADKIADKIARLEKALETEHEDETIRVIAWRMAMWQAVQALAIFTDLEHGEITRRDWEQIIKAESHAREILE